MIVLMVVLWSVPENKFHTFLLWVHHQVIKKKEPRINLFEKLNKPVLSHTTFYVQNDDQKALDFNGETRSLTCELIKIY